MVDYINIMGADIENIIQEYKEDLEHAEKYKLVLEDIRNIKYINEDLKNDLINNWDFENWNEKYISCNFGDYTLKIKNINKWTGFNDNYLFNDFLKNYSDFKNCLDNNESLKEYIGEFYELEDEEDYLRFNNCLINIEKIYIFMDNVLNVILNEGLEDLEENYIYGYNKKYDKYLIKMIDNL